MDERVLRIFESFEGRGNCCERANDLARRVSKLGIDSRVRRVFHKDNTFGDNPLVVCNHVCGENYQQHFVVEVGAEVLDLKLDFPVHSSEYLQKAYLNPDDLVLS